MHGMQRLAMVVVGVALAMAACEGPGTSAGKDPDRPKPSSTKSPPSPPKPSTRWACVKDADCLNSCAAGAVNAAWYATAKISECHDGCANQVAAPPRCIDQTCVAFQVDPHDESKVTRNESCTHREK